MKLDDYRTSDNISDQRGGGGGPRFPIGGGKMGIGTILILGIAALVFGINPMELMQGGGMTGGAPVQTQGAGAAGGQSADQSCAVDEKSKFSCQVLASTEDTWGALFKEQGETYQPATLTFYDRNGQSGCGAAQSAMGPFYCPADNGIYLDTSFFDELATRFGAAGDFAQAYVIAHEVGHHIQTISGRSDQVRRAQRTASEAQGNDLQVRMELEADCYAGVWAARNRERIEPGDIEEGLTAANAIGDDTLQKAAGRRPVPESFTHGTSAQRMAWLKKGLSTGDPAQCDTFSAARL
ncbi:KPN_02809 family neutral zinc metallopeptidase [Blastomonas fulva]|uniref:KPN_02809 family neutral zinc metallopeptidase n=1 Tax=Blastomonas fulva TaxID=1550728 RepID=UPI0025A3DA47|nr:neutral zinc metallopeptidase [Blastomonas fulva]MDM7928474.1 neutral zinc metallopeptidase [Blastomonas fulva]MDM7967599.1 neutral zinc metallopeptidase [Blastomonas fulva]